MAARVAAYDDKKAAEGKTHKGALRSLKRRISDAIYACLLADARRAGQRPARTAREGNRGTTLTPARPAHTPNAGSSDKPLPDLDTTIRPGTRGSHTLTVQAEPKENPDNHLTAATKRTRSARALPPGMFRGECRSERSLCAGWAKQESAAARHRPGVRSR
jgi:hypothetical protein